MLYKTPGLSTYISGVILHWETLFQSDAEGKKMVDLITGNGMIPGIKLDKGYDKSGCAARRKVARCTSTPARRRAAEPPRRPPSPPPRSLPSLAPIDFVRGLPLASAPSTLAAAAAAPPLRPPQPPQPPPPPPVTLARPALARRPIAAALPPSCPRRLRPRRLRPRRLRPHRRPPSPSPQDPRHRRRPSRPPRDVGQGHRRPGQALRRGVCAG